MSINLELFCDREHPFMDKPWSLDDRTYATNGHILISVPRDERYAENPGAPLAREININPDKDGKWVNVSEIKLSEKIKCRTCNGTGKVDNCHECDGEGYLTFYSGYHDYECECKTCQGDGKIADGSIECEDCKGEGANFGKYSYIEIRGTKIAQCLVDLCKNLPNAKLFFPHNEQGIIPLVFDGGNGGIMRMHE